MSTKQHVLIVGAGIGGLTVAIALHQAGFTVEVFERAPEFKEVGAGLLLWANAVRALDRINLADQVRHISLSEASGAIRSWRGWELIDMSPRKLEQLLGEVNVVIHRADLMQVLLNAMPPDTIHLNAMVQHIRQNEQGVELELADGRVFRGDVLIGADGIRSVVRNRVVSTQELRYAGYVAWRGVTPFPHNRLRLGETMGRGARFGMAPLPDERVYWYATENRPAGAGTPPEGYKAHLLKLFKGWHEPIEEIIEATDESVILLHDLYDLPTLPRWSVGRVTLLGDAAHAMTPNLGQGACQAIEDAIVLARCLSGSHSIEAAFQQYEHERKDRTASITKQSRLLGEMGQWSNPLACELRDRLFRYVLSFVQASQIKHTAGFRV